MTMATVVPTGASKLLILLYSGRVDEVIAPAHPYTLITCVTYWPRTLACAQS